MAVPVWHVESFVYMFSTDAQSVAVGDDPTVCPALTVTAPAKQLCSLSVWAAAVAWFWFRDQFGNVTPQKWIRFEGLLYK